MQVLNACVKGKQWEGAFWVLQQLKMQNIRPSAATYGLVMEVLVASGVSMTYGYITSVHFIES
jgi:pentatricopeptide repeat protein